MRKFRPAFIAAGVLVILATIGCSGESATEPQNEREQFKELCASYLTEYAESEAAAAMKPEAEIDTYCSEQAETMPDDEIAEALEMFSGQLKKPNAGE